MGLIEYSDDADREALKLMTLEYSIEESGRVVEEPIVELFCRDADGNRRRIDVEGFHPYFYVTEDEYKEKEDDVLSESMVRRVEVRDRILSRQRKANSQVEPVAKPPRQTLDGRNLVKIYTIKPSQVSKMRDFFDEHWEADVFYTNRFLIDSGIKTHLTAPKGDDVVSYDEIQSVETDDIDIKPRMVTVDIEVWSGGVFPDTQNPKKPVTAITAHDTYDEEYFCAVLHPDAVDRGDAHTWADVALDWNLPDGVEDGTIDVGVYDSEVEMLDAFNKWTIGKDPDLLTGWNSSRNDIGSGFDYPYLINRCERLNVWSAKNLSYDNGGVYVTNRGAPVIEGTEMFDMLQAYKKTQIHEKRRYSLGYISQDELGYGKEDVADLDKGWLHEPVDFIEYNIRDTQAVHEIEKAKSVLEIYDHIRSIAGATYSEIADSNIGIIDMLFLRQAKEKGYALPTSEKPDVQHYWGAYVFPPVAGKHLNVVYPDLKCFTPDHDVLTVDGLKSIDDVSVGDTVYSINPDTGAVERKPVVETYEYPDYNGEVVNFSGERVDFSVTPNHRMLYQDGDDYYFEEAGAYDGRRRALPNADSGIGGDGIDVFDMTEYIDVCAFDVRCSYDMHGHTYRSSLPDNCEKKRANYHEGFFFDGGTFKDYQQELEELSSDVSLSHPDGGGSTFRPHKFDGDNFIELLGWVIAEGSVYYPDDSNTAVVQVAQEKHSDEVAALFERLGLSYSETDGAYTFGSKIYGDFFREYTGANSFEKQIPSFVFERASVEQKELLLETLMKGDGHGNTYYTSSEKLAEDVVRLATECAMKAKISKRRGSEYEVVITETNDGINSYQEYRSTAENGVYCIEVADNNTMLVGRDGKLQWCGNSLYPNLFRDMNASPETIIGDDDDLAESEYTEEDCHTIYVDPRSEQEKKDADEPERTELYVLKPAVKESFIREIVGELIDMKYEYKKDEYADEAYGAVKRVVNSVYGVMGDSKSYGKGFRLFDWRIAEAITLAGRDVIKHTASTFEERVQETGYTEAEIIAGDTDSCVCKVPGADGMDETLDVAHDAAEYVNKTYPQFMENRFGIEDGNMEVEIESYAQSALFMDKKKRYAQWVRWDEGDYVDEVERKGFELVRSDSAEITAEVQTEVIDRILKQESPRGSVKEYLREEWDDVMDGDVSLDELGTPSAVNNDLMDYGWSVQTVDGDDNPPLEVDSEMLEKGDEYVKYYTPQPHICGARYANCYIDGEDISEGSKPLMFYLNGVQPTGEYPETYNYDDRLSLNAPSHLPDWNDASMHELGREIHALSVEDVRNIPSEARIDYEKMAEKTIRDPVEPIVNVMGWDFDDLTTTGEQSGLAEFM